ncbi:ATP-dependent helicase HrpB [Hyalangium versicolor]|uniref:ATP-dependent helicase HrpB n=1 Tax=Hyalangium versicolor TaxID=2861190 RepID=UPI001CC9C178|nr:ATP-dependent helicase HrpB [Hyalangium versicolor]
MTGPMTGIAAAQLVQPKPPDQTVPQGSKPGESKFDAVLADKAQAASGPDAARQTESVQGPEPVHTVEGVAKTERPVLNMVSHVVSELEQGQLRLDQLIGAGVSGQQLSNSELLSLQASMYKYTMELDLTSKVVEKATSGLKDVVKTQV